MQYMVNYIRHKNNKKQPNKTEEIDQLIKMNWINKLNYDMYI